MGRRFFNDALAQGYILRPVSVTKQASKVAPQSAAICRSSFSVKLSRFSLPDRLEGEVFSRRASSFLDMFISISSVLIFFVIIIAVMRIGVLPSHLSARAFPDEKRALMAERGIKAFRGPVRLEAYGHIRSSFYVPMCIIHRIAGKSKCAKRGFRQFCKFAPDALHSIV